MVPKDEIFVYQAFLLRCWVGGRKTTERTVWRFSLEPVGGGKRVGFRDLEALAGGLFDPQSPIVAMRQAAIFTISHFAYEG